MKNILCLTLMFLLTATFVYPKNVTIPQDTKYNIANGYVMIKGGTSAALHPNATLQSGILASPFIYRYGNIATLEFAAGERINFHANGSLQGGNIAKPTEIKHQYGTFHMGAGNWISINDKGQIGRIDIDKTVRVSYIEKFPSNNKFAVKKYIYFVDGLPETTYLVSDTNFKYKQQVKISNKSEYTLKKDTLITFHKTGYVQQGTPAKNISIRVGIRKKTCKAGNVCVFKENGVIK